jgi:transposase
MKNGKSQVKGEGPGNRTNHVRGENSRGRYYTNPVTRARVLLKRSQGYTKKAIARQENIGHSTVTKILNDAEAQELVDQSRRDFKALTQESVIVLLDNLRKRNGESLALAERILRSTGIMLMPEDYQQPVSPISLNLTQQQNQEQGPGNQSQEWTRRMLEQMAEVGHDFSIELPQNGQQKRELALVKK